MQVLSELVRELSPVYRVAVANLLTGVGTRSELKLFFCFLGGSSCHFTRHCRDGSMINTPMSVEW